MVSSGKHSKNVSFFIFLAMTHLSKYWTFMEFSLWSFRKDVLPSQAEAAAEHQVSVWWARSAESGRAAVKAGGHNQSHIDRRERSGVRLFSHLQGRWWRRGRPEPRPLTQRELRWSAAHGSAAVTEGRHFAQVLLQEQSSEPSRGEVFCAWAGGGWQDTGRRDKREVFDGRRGQSGPNQRGEHTRSLVYAPRYCMWFST